MTSELEAIDGSGASIAIVRIVPVRRPILNVDLVFCIISSSLQILLIAYRPCLSQLATKDHRFKISNSFY